MCQLLGMNAAKPADLRFSLTGFAARGGLTDHHGDGFGVGFFEDKACRIFMDSQPAATSPVAELLKSFSIKSRNVVSHIRKATQGDPLQLENCHPFTRELWGRHWLFAHNGDLLDYNPIPAGHYQPVGTTDSERAFCMLMERLKQISPREPCSLSTVFETLCTLSEETAEFGVFNYLLSNGQALFAHCSTRLYYVIREWPFSNAQLVDSDLSIDFAQTNDPHDRVCVVATQPLTRNESWKQLQPGQLLWIEGGQIMRSAQLEVSEEIRRRNAASLACL
ncbi:MAG: class II glutamine amidotransferase [Pseudomonadota bacterium]